MSLFEQWVYAYRRTQANTQTHTVAEIEQVQKLTHHIHWRSISKWRSWIIALTSNAFLLYIVYWFNLFSNFRIVEYQNRSGSSQI